MRTAFLGKLFISSLLLVTAACASTYKKQVYRDMALAGAAGFIAGQSQNSNRNAYSIMYAGLAASGAAALSLYFNDPDAKIQKYKKETEDLRKQLDDAFAPAVERTLPGTLSGKVPDKYKSLIDPGEWRIYAIDQWIEDGENRLIHQDKVMELIPPSLKPIQIPIKPTNHQGGSN